MGTSCTIRSDYNTYICALFVRLAGENDPIAGACTRIYERFRKARGSKLALEKVACSGSGWVR